MKTTLGLCIFLITPLLSFSQWTLDKGHTKFTFIASHHGISEVDGYFKKFEGKITASKEDLSDAVFDVDVETASINTDLEMRDNHLKSEDMFDVAKFPAMTFRSTSFKKKEGNKYTLTGNLTIKGVTKPITFDAVVNGPVKNPNPNGKNMQVGMKATTTIKRSDFGIGGKLQTIMVGDEIEVRVTGEFNKPL
ncbi:MAG: YceI family protein [Spirosomaceae bacterium]|jgi:polyisoprenoid-binding protein YceI|nr:YceI family protein [Spirosomataceae bacterium]